MTTTVRLTWWVNGHRIERDLLKARACPKCSTTARTSLRTHVEPHGPYEPVACGLCAYEYALDQRPRSIRDTEDAEQRKAAWEAAEATFAAAEKQLLVDRLAKGSFGYRGQVDNVSGPAMPVPTSFAREPRPEPLRVPVLPAMRLYEGTEQLPGVARERALQRALPPRSWLERLLAAVSRALRGWRQGA